MSDTNSIQATLAAKAGHEPAPEVERAVAATQSTPDAEHQDDSQTASPDAAIQIEPSDHAGSVLQHVPLDTETLADIWDEVYRAPNADALARSLEKFDIPKHVVSALVVAKKLIDTEHPEPSRADKLKTAAQHMASIPPATLELLEQHPQVLKHLLGNESKKD